LKISRSYVSRIEKRIIEAIRSEFTQEWECIGNELVDQHC
jgi:hypothetical protein